MTLPTYQYSGACYVATAGQTTFALTTDGGNAINYARPDHIKVRTSADSGNTWTDLVLGTDWLFADPPVSVVLTTPAVVGIAVDIYRDTPLSEDFIRFEDGNLLTAGQLNDFDDWQLYIDQEIVDAATNVDAGLDGRYVKKSGDDMTGDLTLGTDKITLDHDGSIVINSTTETVGFTHISGLGTADFGQLTWAGLEIASNDTDAEIRFSDRSMANLYFWVNRNEAIFGVNTTIGNSSQIVLNTDGTASFDGNVSVGGITFDDNTTISTKPVTRLIAGTNITLVPSSGVGDVSISAAQGGGDGGVYGGITPPDPAHEWDLWWNSEDGVLYVYYKDEDATEQWIPASPQPAGDEDKYVRLVGDNMTGMLSVSTNACQLRPDGAAQFANGDVTISSSGDISTTGQGSFGSGNVILAANSGITVNDGIVDIYAQTTNATGEPLRIQSDIGGTKTKVAVIKADGSATFTGNVNVGDSGTLGTYVRVERGDTGNVWSGNGPAGNTSSITEAGSATFAGDVQVAGFPEDGAANGAVIRSSGAIQASRAAGSTLWAGYKTGTQAYTSRIDSNGNGTFKGTVEGVGNNSYAFRARNAANQDMGGIYINSAGANFYLRDGSADKVTLTASGNGIFENNLRVNNNLAVYAAAGSIYEGYSTSTGSSVNTFSVNADGTIRAVNTTIQPISSERRLKENIVAIDSNDAWETIKSTPYYAYNFIGSEATNYGPMADEVPAEMIVQPMEEVVIEEAVEQVIGPKGTVLKEGKEAVTETRPRSDDEGPIRTYDNGMLQARLYTALQTALSRIEALEAEVNALKAA